MFNRRVKVTRQLIKVALNPMCLIHYVLRRNKCNFIFIIKSSVKASYIAATITYYSVLKEKIPRKLLVYCAISVAFILITPLNPTTAPSV